MHAVAYHGVHIKFCLSCRGMFMTPEQFTAILESQETTSINEPPKNYKGERFATYDCPTCETTFERQTHGKILKTQIDVCEVCKCIWLDKGELERIKYDFDLARANTDISQGRRIKCKKCGHVQDKADKCSQCGVYFNKVDAPSTPGRKRKKLNRSLGGKILDSIIDKFEKISEKKARHTTATRVFLNSLDQNPVSHYMMKAASWVVILASGFVGWLILQFIFNNIASPPPRPTGFYADLSRTSIFYIFGIALAGPVVLFVAYVLWKILWFTLYDPIQSITHRFFHPLVKPMIALCLSLLVFQSAALFANGFWTTFWWLNQQVEQAKGHEVSD